MAAAHPVTVLSATADRSGGPARPCEECGTVIQVSRRTPRSRHRPCPSPPNRPLHAVIGHGSDTCPGRARGISVLMCVADCASRPPGVHGPAANAHDTARSPDMHRRRSRRPHGAGSTRQRPAPAPSMSTSGFIRAWCGRRMGGTRTCVPHSTVSCQTARSPPPARSAIPGDCLWALQIVAVRSARAQPAFHQLVPIRVVHNQMPNSTTRPGCLIARSGMRQALACSPAYRGLRPRLSW